MEAIALADDFCVSCPDVAEQFKSYVLVGRARLLFLDGRLDEAAGVCVRATICADKQGQARAEAYAIRSDFLELMGDREGALISAIRGAAASTAAKCKTEAYLKIFRLHLEAGEYEEARDFASKAMELVPTASRRMVASIARAVADLRKANPEVAESLEAVLLSPTA
jgi:tetratricopeptide (TPR) repeat protein